MSKIDLKHMFLVIKYNLNGTGPLVDMRIVENNCFYRLRWIK
jgi:hypothetical protein